jgi:hypothetical protein
MSSFKFLSSFSIVFGPQNSCQKCHQICSMVKFAEQNSSFILFSRNLYRRYPKDFKFQNSDYRGHQVGLKNSGSQNLSFLAFKGGAIFFVVFSVVKLIISSKNWDF